MFSTCIFCHRSLGRNETIEPFPVGRRLAFDPLKGRLWVICPACRRWNLSPVEERWEAVEWCERRFRLERTRVHTDNIGLARLASGVTLVRIGPALRPEFAAWRYGDVFGRRRRAAWMRRIAFGGASAALYLGSASGTFESWLGRAAAMMPGLWMSGWAIAQAWLLYRENRRAVRVPGKHGKLVEVIHDDLSDTELIESTEPEGWALLLRSAGGRSILTGWTARRALGAVLPLANQWGAGKEEVAEATSVLGTVEHPEEIFRRVALRSTAVRAQYDRDLALYNREGNYPNERRDLRGRLLPPLDRAGLLQVPPVQRLALEMALHEETERRALEGELKQLELMWREAELVAAIADDLLLKPEVEAQLQQLRNPRT